MKAFRFPLDRALHIRRAQLEIEQAKLQGLARDREQLELQVVDVLAEAATTRRTISAVVMLDPAEICTVPDFQRNTTKRLDNLDRKKQEIARFTVAQQAQTIEAERKVKLLEKLRSRRFTAWELQMAKDQENFASDAYLARWTVSS